MQKIIIYSIPVIFAITVHEVAHGWVANKLGDRTAKIMGRLTLNPLKHIDLVGTIIVPLILLMAGNFLFGWAKPVPVDWRNLRRPRQDMAWVALAGPAANLLMLILWTLFAKLVASFGQADPAMAQPLIFMALAGVLINIILMVLNLIPLPPLDGSRVMSALLPSHLAVKYNQLEPYGMIILLLLFATGILGKYFWPVIVYLQNLVESFL